MKVLVGLVGAFSVIVKTSPKVRCKLYHSHRGQWGAAPLMVIVNAANLVIRGLLCWCCQCYRCARLHVADSQSRTKVSTDPLRCKCRVKWNCRLQRRRDGVRQQLQCCSDGTVTGDHRHTGLQQPAVRRPTHQPWRTVRVANTDLASRGEVGCLSHPVHITKQTKVIVSVR